MILSAKMMLDHMGEAEMAKKLEDAVAEVIAEGKVRTYDMGGSNTSLEVAEEVVKNMGP
ncbi:MAG: isocitrate/isopropylmalate dehydrogenase family protein, partial [Thermoplasmata archaeon]|nr:isocitrate/isopropylmalate dehydrogenase family protein [Thermoplasmata archaeon]